MLLVDEREADFLLSNWAQSKVEELNRFSLIPEMCPFLLEQEMRICKVEGCNKKHLAKGLCQNHYRIKNRKHILEYQKQWYRDNKEKIIRQSNKYYLDNKEYSIKKHKQYNNEHKDEIAKYQKQFYQDNKEHIKKLSKQYHQDNKERRAKCAKQYHQDNKERITERHKQYMQTPVGKASIKAYDHNRRALLKDLTKETVQQVYEDNIKKYGVLTCYLCFKPIINNDDSLDHSTPLTRQGTNDYENLGIAHSSCNSKKHTKTLEEWNNENI